MGSYFSNLHVKKGGATLDSVKKVICGDFLRVGYTVADASCGDFCVELYAPENSPWISVYSESFTHDYIVKLNKTISASLDTDVLSIACFDSDYMFLNLVNVNKRANLWLNVGELYEMKLPGRSNLLKWKKHISDFDSFKNAAEQDYVCAEDFLAEVEKHLDLPYGQSAEWIRENAGSDIEKLYFSAPKDENMDKTKLKIKSFSLTPCIPGLRTGCFVENNGAASKGIRVLFIGDYVEGEDITLEDTAFVCHDADGELVETPISFKKVQLESGGWAYLWEDKDFPIPEVVSSALPPRARQEAEYRRSFGIRFKPVGNKRKFLDICIVFDPLENAYDGHCWWRVWGYHPTKKEYIDYTNNERLQDAKMFGINPSLIDPDEYDLD